MEAGFIGEYYVYYLDEQNKLLVSPDEEIAPNFEHYKKFNKNVTKKMFRGLRSIILNKTDKILPVKIKNTEGFYEGLYILKSKETNKNKKFFN